MESLLSTFVATAEPWKARPGTLAKTKALARPVKIKLINTYRKHVYTFELG